MPKRQVNIRISDATWEKLRSLTGRYGTQAEAVAVAIDRMYQAEITEEESVDWTKRVGELRQLAREFHNNGSNGTTVGDYPTPEAYVDDLVTWIIQCQEVTPESDGLEISRGPNTLDADDIRVIRDELERYVF